MFAPYQYDQVTGPQSLQALPWEWATKTMALTELVIRPSLGLVPHVSSFPWRILHPHLCLFVVHNIEVKGSGSHFPF